VKVSILTTHFPQLIYSKLAEMFAEAIPAGVLQMHAFIQSPNRSTAAFGSIIISAMTTGFGSALVSYDSDTSPKRRRQTPDFYGFVPPTGRGLIFFLMVMNSIAQFLAKIMAIGLLGAVSKTWVVLYMVGDIGLFLLYTIARNDFLYYIPVQSFVGSLAVSFLTRTLIKVRAEHWGTEHNVANVPQTPPKQHTTK
jgi:hypothetical protein